MPRISVIIPTYNCGRYISEAIESVMNQTYQDYELIIVNDGSIDNTDDIVGKYLPLRGDKVIYVNQKNRGVGCARNTGIEASTGEFVAFLDADDIWLPEKLAEQISIFDSSPQIGFLHTNAYGFGGEKGTYVGRYWMTSEQLDKHSGKIFHDYFFRNIRITTSTVMVRKECIERHGLFDDYLSRLGSEDRELFLRILWDTEAVFIDQPLAKYRDRTDSTGTNIANMTKGQEYTYNKIAMLYELPKKFKRKALSSVYLEWASANYANYDFFDGMRLQLKAIKEDPLNIKSYLFTKRLILKAISMLCNVKPRNKGYSC